MPIPLHTQVRTFRATEQQSEQLERAAELVGQRPTVWFREVLLRQAERIIRKAERNGTDTP